MAVPVWQRSLADGEELNDADLTEMVTVFKKCLPTYAVPVFYVYKKGRNNRYI